MSDMREIVVRALCWARESPLCAECRDAERCLGRLPVLLEAHGHTADAALAAIREELAKRVPEQTYGPEDNDVTYVAWASGINQVRAAMLRMLGGEG